MGYEADDEDPPPRNPDDVFHARIGAAMMDAIAGKITAQQYRRWFARVAKSGTSRATEVLEQRVEKILADEHHFRFDLEGAVREAHRRAAEKYLATKRDEIEARVREKIDGEFPRAIERAVDDVLTSVRQELIANARKALEKATR